VKLHACLSLRIGHIQTKQERSFSVPCPLLCQFDAFSRGPSQREVNTRNAWNRILRSYRKFSKWEAIYAFL